MKRILDNGVTLWESHYQSGTALISEIKHALKNSSTFPRRYFAAIALLPRKGNRRDWFEMDSLPEAMDACTHGRPDLVGKFADKLRLVLDADRKTETVQEMIYSVIPECGFDMGRVLTGEPESGFDWQQTERQKDGSRNVRLVVRISQNYDNSAADLQRRGLLVASIIDAIETQGIRCEIIVSDFSKALGFKDKFNWISLVIKHTEDPLDIDKLAFWIACPDAFRRIFFCATSLQVENEGFPDNDDTATDPNPDLIKQVFGKETVYIGGDTMATKDQIIEQIKVAVGDTAAAVK